MRFLVDECIGPAVAEWLRGRGHEVFSVFDESRGLDDSAIIEKAYHENWILITADKDFGDRACRQKSPHHGVVLLRLDDRRAAMKIDALRRLLHDHSNEIADRFTVVTETRVRIAQD